MTIGEAIREERLLRNITQDELARSLHMAGKSRVSLWETGKAIPDDQQVVALEKVFGITNKMLLRLKAQYQIKLYRAEISLLKRRWDL